MRKKLLMFFTIFLMICASALAQERTISGMITSAEDGSALPGVNVRVQGSSIGTISDAQGRYSIRVPSGFNTIEFSFIGMESRVVTIGISDNIDIAMESSSQLLDEVVVTALGIERKAKAIGFAQQELKSDQLSAARETNLTSFLTAKVAGVRVSKTASGTGGSSAITIRGAKSLLGNNQPLFVLDGVPITNIGNTSGGTWEGLDLGDGMSDLNPEDIESMQVLKGPNASALYGSRGSNGVILITTKSGRQKKGIGVELNSNFSLETLNLFPTYQNYYATGYEDTNLYGSFVEIPEGSGKFYETMDTWHGDSWGPPMDGRRVIVDPFMFPDEKPFSRTFTLLPQPANNVREFYNKGIGLSNTLAISASDEKTSARLSVGHGSNTGIIPNSKWQKQTIVLNVNSRVTDYLSFDGKISYLRDEGNNRPILGTMYQGGNVSQVFAVMGRYVPMDFLKEYYERTKSPGTFPAVQYNPYYIVNELKSRDVKDRIIGQISTTLKITDWLSLMGRAGTDYYTLKLVRTWPVGSKISDNTRGRVYNEISLVKDINADIILTATKELSSQISGNLSVGSSILHQERNNQSIDGRVFKAPGVYDVSNCTDIRPYTWLSRKQMQSVFFTGQLAYNNYLFLDVTGRNDWSSALGINNYSFFYPSVSTSFVFTDAFPSLAGNVLTFGKVRASWAQVGNDSDPYLTRNGYASTTTTYAGQPISWMNSTIPLFDLKNELTASWEIGTNLRFLNNRIDFDFTYYDGKTTNQILPISISNSSGYSDVVINAGEIQNKGIEIALNLNPVRTSTGFSWDINANYSRNRSMVVSLAPGIETLVVGGGASATIEARPGQPYGNIVGYPYMRAPDGQKIVDETGSYLFDPQLTVLGNITPDWIGGLNNTFSFKGFSMNVLLDFVQGNEITSVTKYQMEAKGTGKWTVEGRRLRDMDDEGNQLPLVGILDGVVEIDDGEGNITYEKNTKAVDGQTYWAMRAWGSISEEFVMDGSYISLREVMLSYSFSPSRLAKTPFAGITLSLIGRNLLYLEEHMMGMGVSPESSPNTSAGWAGTEYFAMPTTRTWGFNVKLTF
ncbi:MAG TPA: SusC/RagA family TonB-linked outer membrane protein [Bacteroidales bacterium]|jgi:TonB-linked SusC/RagA family outer membrane protein|nr:SusC/RagA family TonB-linked outer membrane protein [Bacteroidales bacterium]HQH23652.1 SusC/RagA family TonB-linked outer membrane protein [Bacteroidales bacterium]HQJ81174.1 SusC/RagA family TonB-linked outer membrane protein [Bacteroidales bacterium]